MDRTRLAFLLAASWLAVSCGIEPTTDPWSPPTRAAQAKAIAGREACAVQVAEKQPLFGDLHIHTGISMDANSMGTLASPDDAYRYAQGEAIDVFSGDPTQGMRSAQIDRPLDFAAVTDHAEWMAEVSLCTTPGSATYDTSGCQIYRGRINLGSPEFSVSRVLKQKLEV